MRRTKNGMWVLALVLAGGCLDLGLLDELVPFDAGREGEDSDVDADSDSDGDADGDGPPATDADDTAPPALAAMSCAAAEEERDGLCVAVGNGTAAIRFTTDEPASAAAQVDGARAEVVSEPWSTEHLVVAAGLPAAAEIALGIALEDVNGNSSQLAVSVLALGGPTVAITEVLADPAGAEPAQELVEIANTGIAEIDLAGWMIDDNGDADGDLLPDGCSLAPGQVAILVGPGYDPASAEDPAPAAGAVIVFLESAIGTSGLKNDAVESVELYDADGALVSAYDGRVGDPVEGRSAARVRAEAPDGCPLAFGDAPVEPPTPGEAPFVP